MFILRSNYFINRLILRAIKVDYQLNLSSIVKLKLLNASRQRNGPVGFLPCGISNCFPRCGSFVLEALSQPLFFQQKVRKTAEISFTRNIYCRPSGPYESL